MTKTRAPERPVRVTAAPTRVSAVTTRAVSRHVVVPASGTLMFPTDEKVRQGLFTFDLVEPDAMKERLNQISMTNFMTCIDEALRKSGYTRQDVGFLNMILVKPSAYRDMLSRLGLTEQQGVYNDTIGHIGEQDSIINIVRGLESGRLQDGAVMLIVGAGIGYVWGATVVRWGENTAL